MGGYERKFLRRTDEVAKFRCLVQTLVWLKGKTGLSSAEVISAIIRRRSPVEVLMRQDYNG